MAQVPDRILTWLYRVLQEYQDPQRSYSDAARTLSAFPTLTPRTEVYHYENGSSALLLTLSNTIPVNFRGTTYRFPIKIWIPQSYPREPPTVYVTPSADMLIRPGQHVGVDGRVYHPYLADWGKRWERASVAEFLEYLQQAFAKEPPVISRAQQMQYQQRGGQQQQQQQAGASPAPPQLPPKQSVESAQQAAEMSSGATPPPRPPKPGEEAATNYPVRTSSRQVSSDGPPLPPLPHERPQTEAYTSPKPYQNGYGDPNRSQNPANQPPYQSGRSSGPPLPSLPSHQSPQQHQPFQQQQFQQQRPAYERSPVSPVSPINGYSELPETKYAHPPPIPHQPPPRQHQHYPQGPARQQLSQPQLHHQQQGYQQAPPVQPPYPPQQSQQYGLAQPPPQQPFPPQQQLPPQQKKQPPPDLLSDPFDITLPSPSHQASAPPIPPNPEKEHLLHALSSQLSHLAQSKISQNLSALAPLRAQHQALLSARANLEQESRQLDHLNATLASNEAILRRSIQDCDRTIQAAREKPPPPIDEVLIAPTVVANQLWRLCAEEAACKEAMYVLQRAVDRGRIGGEGFVRQMRGLGRECFLKMVLARKCAEGLGLEV